jgi:signal recognition particle subunit SRP54
MFENLSQRLGKIVKTLKGETRLTEKNTTDMLREIRMALLEADVALPVVKELTKNIQEKALGKEVLDSLSPGQVLVSIVEKELTALMQSQDNENAINLATQPPAIILMAGLQGSGKTTTTGKLAKYLQEQLKKKVMLVSADVYRPAAIHQLEILSKQINSKYFAANPEAKPLDIAKDALAYAKQQYVDVLIVDTAGRLGIDQAMMDELKSLQNYLQPIETLFVVDAMQGQDALNTAKAFNQSVELTGIVLTKTDGDSRGGAALSVKHIIQKPIKFIGTSEKIDGLQVFDAKRVAQRILGMGDILALVEQAQQNFDAEKAEKMVKKLKDGEGFDLNDFLDHLQQMDKMGGLGNLIDKLPTEMAKHATTDKLSKMETQTKRMRGIIHSMTPKERAQPNLLKATRKKRIAIGAGVHVQEVNRLLKQFEEMQGMLKQLKGGGMMKMMRAMGGLKQLKDKFMPK